MCHFSTRVDTNTSLHARSLHFISLHCLLVSWTRMCSPMWSPCWSQAEGDDILEMWENFEEISEGSQVQVCSSPSRLSQERAYCCCHHKGAGTQADSPHPYLQLDYVDQPWPLSPLSCIHQLWTLSFSTRMWSWAPCFRELKLRHGEIQSYKYGEVPSSLLHSWRNFWTPADALAHPRSCLQGAWAFWVTDISWKGSVQLGGS